MAKALQDLLNNTSPLFTVSIQALERSTGNEGVDVRLIGDTLERAHAVMRQLGLDTADTTARELYLALNSYLQKNPNIGLLIDTDYVLLLTEGELVSFNLIDVIENFHHHLPFEQRSVAHAQRALRGELLMRDQDHPRTHAATTTELAQTAGVVDESDSDHPTVTQFNISQGEVPMNQDDTTPYVISAGDIFTDAFIKLNDDVASVITTESGEKRLTLPLGTKPPYDRVDIVKAVGPSPNAAVSFARLGLKSGLDTFLGDDETGTEALEYLQQENVITEDVLVEKGLKTNYYFVLRYGAERTILVHNEQFDYTWETPKQTPEWFYLALMSDASWAYHEDMLAYLNQNPSIKLAFQPGTFHFEWGVKKLRGIYERSHIIILNREEAVDVTGGSYDDLAGLLDGLHALGPKIAVITDGPSGSYASDSMKKVRVPNYPDPAPPVDRTGAGDAFASTIVAALALGESIETALMWAPINSMNVVQNLGAQKGLLTKEKLLEFLSNSPEDYKISDL